MNERYMRIGEIPAKIYEGENAKRAVLALHGFGGSKESFAIKQLAQRLCGRGFSVVAIDWLCHGERTCDFSELSIESCIQDMKAAEEWIAKNVSRDLCVFATSFGGYVALLRAEMGGAPFRRLALRVPAVNMADSLASCARVTAGEGADNAAILDRAKREGFFRVRTSAEFRVPFSFYERLAEHSAVRPFSSLASLPTAVVYAENDELVRREDAERFLALNPAVRAKMIPACGHRMAESAEKLGEALDFAAEFLAE